MNTNFLSGTFKWLHDVIEDADRPIALLVMVLLPFIAPVIPAWITAQHLQTYMDYTPAVALMAAVAFALVGYVAMVSAIGNITTLVENPDNNRQWFPVVVSSGSYIIYVLALVMVNIILEVNSGTVTGPQTAVTAIMTLGLELPTALLNGTRISFRQREDAANKLHAQEVNEGIEQQEREHRNELEILDQKSRARLAALEIKAKAAGLSVAQTPAPTVRPKSTSQYRDEIWDLFDRCWDQTRKPAQIKEVTNALKLDYKKAGGYIHGQRKLWAIKKGVDLSKYKL